MTKREIEALALEVLVPEVSLQIEMDVGQREPVAIFLRGGNDEEFTPSPTPKRYSAEQYGAPTTSTRILSPQARAAFEPYRTMVDQTGDAGDVDDLLVPALETATVVEGKRPPLEHAPSPPISLPSRGRARRPEHARQPHTPLRPP